MKMLGQAHQAFVEADLAYRRDRIAAAFDHSGRAAGAGVAGRLRQAFRTRSHGQPQRHLRAAPSPHH